MDTQTLQPALTNETISAIVAQTVAAMRASQDKGQGGLGAMPSAWVQQRAEQVRTMGAEHAPHYCYWIDPDKVQRSKSCGKGRAGEKLAHQLARKVEAELLLGTYGSSLEKTWDEFTAEYLEKAAHLSPLTLIEIRTTFKHFARLMKPGRVSRIKTATIDGYKSARVREDGPRGGIVSHATINKELRNLRAALRKAKRWGYTENAPEFEFLRELGRLPCYVPPEQFTALYAACGIATLPHVQGIDPPDYWRALLLLIYLTGWRIEQVQLLRRTDLNLDTGEVFSDAADNKGGRDVKLVLHPLAVEHLGKLPSFAEHLFPWPHRRMTLWDEFKRIQDEAKVKPDRKRHYGFHDLRRAFATMNADRMSADALQRLMQHQCYTTTQKYLNLARQLRPAAENLFVPELKTGTEG